MALVSMPNLFLKLRFDSQVTLVVWYAGFTICSKVLTKRQHWNKNMTLNTSTASNTSSINLILFV